MDTRWSPSELLRQGLWRRAPESTVLTSSLWFVCPWDLEATTAEPLGRAGRGRGSEDTEGNIVTTDL